MNLQTSPNRWSCLPTSFAMALDVPVSEIIAQLNHDGSEIIRPHANEPDNRRSFHIQELISMAWNLGYAVTPFEPHPTTTIGNGDSMLVPFSEGYTLRMDRVLSPVSGVLTGMSLGGSHHAVAWDHKTCRIYNPNGKIQMIHEFMINTFWAVTRRIVQA